MSSEDVSSSLKEDQSEVARARPGGGAGAAFGGIDSDDSRERVSYDEAGMTSLGLTFHSRRIPALCILTRPPRRSLHAFVPIPVPRFSFASGPRSSGDGVGRPGGR